MRRFTHSKPIQVSTIAIAALALLLYNVWVPLLPTRVLAHAPVSAGPPDRRFGVIESYDAPVAATEMGAGWTRIPFLWSQMQPSGTHEWNPPISDEALANEIARGRQPVGLIITTPGWATDVGIGPGVPVGLHTGHNDPGNLWANFVRQLVSTYAGRIDHWIIWNEPDVWDANHPGYTWGGSVQDFLQLQRVAYSTIKETNPSAKVIFSATSYWWDAAHGRDLYFRRYLDALLQDGNAPGNNYYCDAVALHVYFQPDFVYSITALYHQLMREHGFDKPIWIVETNAAPSLDPQMLAPNALFAITLEEQAAYIIQAFAMGIAGGATRIGVFKMIDTPTDLVANPEPFGLVRADGRRRPAFNAYRVASTYMAGFQGGQLDQRPEASIVTIPRASGTTTVLWTRTPAPASIQIPAQTGSATLVDAWGNRRAIAASNGVYTVQLPGALCTHSSPCIIGGLPYLVIEGSLDAAPPPAQAPPPAPPVVPTTQATEPDTGSGTVASNDAGTPTLVPSTEPDAATPTLPPLPQYTIDIPSETIRAARESWRASAPAGYRIRVIAGPPFYLYDATVMGDTLVSGQRSLKRLTVNLGDLPETPAASIEGAPFAAISMTTRYNQRSVLSYTVEGLFNRALDYYEERPSYPACDTRVSVELDAEADTPLDNPGSFPHRIREHWTGECQTTREPAWLAVIAFSTLTPMPMPKPTATPTAAPTVQPSSTKRVAATATDEHRSTPSATPSISISTKLPSMMPSTTASASSTLSPTPTSVSNRSLAFNPYLWVFLIANALIGTLLLRRNGRKKT